MVLHFPTLNYSNLVSPHSVADDISSPEFTQILKVCFQRQRAVKFWSVGGRKERNKKERNNPWWFKWYSLAVGSLVGLNGEEF